MRESIVDRICGIDIPPETTISAIWNIQAYVETRVKWVILLLWNNNFSILKQIQTYVETRA